MTRTTASLASTLLLFLALGGGCARPADAPPPAHGHAHHPPHGGTPVVLGDEAFHLELVLDPSAGTLQAYVLDGEMENFVRSAQDAITLDAVVGGAPRTVTLGAVADPATGETVGDTALFEGRADWLKGARDFDGTVRSLSVRGATFTRVTFHFPRGNDTD